jgi:cytochrome c553
VSEQFSSIYAGWQVVENAAIALHEATSLITVPGRLCQNGKPVPVDRPVFMKAAEGMRASALVALEAARSKNLEKAIEATNSVAEGCANCHEVYRDKGEADGPERCTP